jgi:hypothetical protein
MNYSVLFPKILNNLPHIDNDSYRYEYMKNYAKERINIYIPQGRKNLIWFTKYNNEPFCFLITIQKNKKITTRDMRFRYASFRPNICDKNGTIIYGTCIEREFVCEKILYLKGNVYKKSVITEHMKDIKQLIENNIRNIQSGDFLNIKLPFMNYSRDFIYCASNLSYPVYEIRHDDNRSHKMSYLMLDFKIKCIDEYRDIYNIYCLDVNRREYCIKNVYVNDFKTSNMLRNRFNKNLKNYREIELSDDEDENDEVSILPTEKTYFVKCLYIKEHKKWKPIKFINDDNIASLKDVKILENKKY